MVGSRFLLEELVEEGGDGYVITVDIRYTALGDAVLPPFTSRVQKLLVHTAPCMAGVLQLYKSRSSFRPVRLTVLRGPSGRRLYQTLQAGRPAGPPLRVRGGETLSGSISIYTRGDPFRLAGELGGCTGRLPSPLDRLGFEVEGLSVERARSLSAGVSSGRVELRIHTPLLVDTRVMAPPPLRRTRLLRFRQAYRLLPTPAYVVAAAARLWQALAGAEIHQVVRAGYVAGRLADAMVAEVDYRLRPTTALYSGGPQGEARAARGPTGWVVYEVLNPRLAPLLDRLLGLASRMGLGKSRSVGFGEVEASGA